MRSHASIQRIALAKSLTRLLNMSVIASTLVLASVVGFASSASAVNAYHNAVFYENVSASDTTYLYQVENVSTALTLFANLSPAFTNPGYTFSGWNTSADGTGTPYADGTTYSFGADLYLYAQWTENRVTFHENATPSDGVTSTQLGASPTNLDTFSSLTPGFSNPGYAFTGWNTAFDGSGSPYADGSTYNFTAGSTSLYAQWSPLTYTVTYDPAGGTVTPSTATYSTGSAPLALPTPTMTGYTFAGWFSAASGGSPVGSAGGTFAPTSSLTLYAQWTANVYTVTFAADGGVVNPSTMSYAIGGTPLTLPSPTFAGYSFSGWFSAPTGGSLVAAGAASYTPAASLTLYAQWVANTYTVTFNANGGSVATPSTTFTTGASPLSLPMATSPGYTFSGWFSAAVGGTLIGVGAAPFTPTATLTLFAQWTPVTVVVTFVGDGATLAVTTSPFTTGAAPLTLPTPTYTGYVFTGWFSAPSGGTLVGAGGAAMTPTTSLTLFAQWTPATYLVSLQPDGGVLATSSLSFTTGTPALTLPTPVLDGSTFLGWFSAASGGTLIGGGGSALSPTSSLTLYAQWRALPTFTVTFISNGTTTSISALQGLVGSPVTIPSSATLSLTGFTFEGWNTAADGSGVSYAPGATIAPTGVTQLYAQWRVVPTVVISFNLNGAAGLMTSLSGLENTTVSVPNAVGISRAGYRFVGWATSASGASALITAGSSLTLSQSEVLYAQWRAEPAAFLMTSVGSFAAHTTVLTRGQLNEVRSLAAHLVGSKYHLVTLYGYVSPGHSAPYSRAMSLRRAQAVAVALRAQLAARGLHDVSIRVVGEGVMPGRSGPRAREVEVFVH